MARYNRAATGRAIGRTVKTILRPGKGSDAGGCGCFILLILTFYLSSCVSSCNDFFRPRPPRQLSIFEEYPSGTAVTVNKCTMQTGVYGSLSLDSKPTEYDIKSKSVYFIESPARGTVVEVHKDCLRVKLNNGVEGWIRPYNLSGWTLRPEE